MTEQPEGNAAMADPADLSLARALADAADAISLPRFGAADLRVDAKPDLSPVSDADLAVEAAIRAILAAERPADVVLGEEFGTGGSPGQGASPPAQAIGQSPRPATRPGQRHQSRERSRRWVLDPIDGTKNFVRGVPVWGSLIALLVDGKPTVGVVSAPALGRRWWGATGLGAAVSVAGGEPRACRVSGVGDLADASLSYSELAEWATAGLADEFDTLAGRCWRTRGYGDFWSYMLVAEGAVDIAAEPDLSLWDLAALAPIVTEAGGRFTGLDGARVDDSTRSALATNGRLHEQVGAILGHRATILA